MEMIYKILEEHNIKDLKQITLEEISNKDGILVYRVKGQESSKILKVFENKIYKREISNYKILMGLGIQTIPVYSFRESSILMEDIKFSDRYRLAVKEDISDPKVIVSLARWYQELHRKGEIYLKNNKIKLYSEYDLITRESITFLKDKINVKNEETWDILNSEIDKLHKFCKVRRTITYNDFYFVNMIVARDYSEAFMFDYNMMGEGLIASDILNVTSSAEKYSEKFIESYGEIDSSEITVNNILAHIFAVLEGFKREKFPYWAEDSLKFLEGENFEKEIIRWREIDGKNNMRNNHRI